MRIGLFGIPGWNLMDAWYQEAASIMPAYWHCLSVTPIGSLRLYAQIQSNERPRRMDNKRERG